MTPEHIAENVKRFTKPGGITPVTPEVLGEAIQTINALVQMVGEMESALRVSSGRGIGIEELGNQRIIDDTLNKVQPIAQLAKGEWYE